MKPIEKLKEYCLGLGFDLFGVVKPGKVSNYKYFQQWLARGYHADMAWLEKNGDKREDWRLILDDCRAIIVLGVSYFNRHYGPEEINDPGRALMARYAWGDDYHEVLKKKAANIINWLDEKYDRKYQHKFYADTGPLLERELGAKAGLGFIGKNGNLINDQIGSYFFITSIFTQIDLSESINLVKGRCGECRRCMDGCPTGAIRQPKTVDARRCIAYHTVENRGEIPADIKKKMKNRIFGCDICQEVCPWNTRVLPTRMEEFRTKSGRDQLKIKTIQNMTVDDYQHLFRKSAVKRAKYGGLKRNVGL
ncbi:MAG: tRNA epoxyqueuosine(34) reductase QueG [Patescibacteria group bacterium]